MHIEIVSAFTAFFALVVAWMILPASPIEAAHRAPATAVMTAS